MRAVLRPDQIAACAWSTDIVGTVTPEAAAQTGLAAGTPVITGTGDSTAEAISVGLVEPGTAFFQYGSSMFYYYCTDHFVGSYVSPQGNGASRVGRRLPCRAPIVWATAPMRRAH